jgi:hypothetical protein
MYRNLVKAFNPGDLYIFTSPWALNYQDEVSQRPVLSLFSVIKNFQLFKFCRGTKIICV